MSLGATASAPARGVRDRRLGEQLEGQVVVDRAVVEHHAAVAVRRVAAQAHVGHHHELRVRVLERAHRQLHDALVVVGARALLVLLGRAARTGAPPGRRARAPRRPPRPRSRSTAARRRASPRPACAPRRAGRTAADQMRRGELGLAHHVAQQPGLAQAPHASGGEGHRQSESTGRPQCAMRTGGAPRRASAPKASASTARCTIGPAMSPLSFSAALRASSVGLNGNSAEIARITS